MPARIERPVEFTLAYHGHNLLHPGLAARVAYRAVERERAALLVGGDLVNWWHPAQEYVFNVRADLAGELRSRRGTAYRLHLAGGFRGGVLATPVYADDGTRASPGLLPQAQWGAALEFAWPIRRSERALAISLQPELMVAHPSFYGADLDFALRLGVLF